MPNRIPTIQNTSDAWRVWMQLPTRISNTALIFERYSQFDVKVDPRRPDIDNYSLSPQLKKENLAQIIDSTVRADGRLFEAWVTRWQASVEAGKATPFTAVTDWRFIPGFGQKNSLEIGMAFNRYGFPFLAGSAVKGITRTAAVIQIAEQLHFEKLQDLDDALNIEVTADEDEILKIQDCLGIPPGSWNAQQKCAIHQFRVIFGTEDHAGQAIFYSAIPAEMPRIEHDVLTPHFSKYYRGANNSFPTDADDPIPVGFITVAAGQKFHFAVGWRGILDLQLRDNAVEWLKFGLTQLGAGAKTTSGYGYFQIPNNVTMSTEAARVDDEVLPPPSPTIIEFRYATIPKQQNVRGSIVAIDKDSDQRYTIPQALFGGSTPPAKSRIEIELHDGKVVGVKLAR